MPIEDCSAITLNFVSDAFKSLLDNIWKNEYKKKNHNKGTKMAI